MIRNVFLFCCLLAIVTSCGNVKPKPDKLSAQESSSKNDSVLVKSNADKDYLDIGFGLMKNESIGEIKTGLTFEKVTQILGEPNEKSEAELSQVDGSYYLSAYYKNKGLDLVFVIDTDSVQRVANIFAKEPCTLKTSKQIGIGSNYEEVEKAYKEFINPEFSDTETIVAGSIYGGMIFRFENGKIVTIYIGISAD